MEMVCCERALEWETDIAVLLRTNRKLIENRKY